ncbi:MAG: UPF0182 family protein [Actinomycetota bacterium]|nr:UPF0182 family protein [Actinomycetota bacterium]
MTLFDELRRRWWLALLGVVAIVGLFASRLAGFYTEVLWYNSVGYADVLWTLLRTRVALGLIAGLVVALLVAGNLLLARRLAPRYRIPSAQEAVVERYRQAIEPVSRPLMVSVAAVGGLLSGTSIVGEWPTFLQWAHAVPFGRDDPQFGLDLGYFLFVLPFHSLVNSWLFTSLALTALLTALAHYVFGGIRPQSPGQKITPQVTVHLSILLAALVAVRGWGFWLDRYLLSFSQRGQITGLSYTDVNAELIGYQLLTIISAVCVVLFLVNVRYRAWQLPSAGAAILVVAAVVLSGLYPAIIQRVQVAPQELDRERPFIERNLEFTRLGYGLDRVSDQPFPAEAELSPAAVRRNARTLESVRLWDPTTLQNTYQQLQEFRPYYDFRDVDVDRYDLDGRRRQVMISVREISEADLPAEAQTWQNRRLEYTHGYGLVASAVSTASQQGQPVFLVNNIPPSGAEELEIDNPRIYFGERPPEYSIVGASKTELDYPRERGEPAQYSYTGNGGVGLGSPLRRLAFALRYGEPNMLLSSLINSESKILFNRSITDRVEAVAPYLKLDHDPYPVAVDGRIKWVIDGYTTSDMMPYSQRSDLGELTISEQLLLVPVQSEDGTLTLEEQSVSVPGLQGTANYIRNSVKAVVDAYDGTITLYVTDPEDPVIQAWQDVFPGAMTPLGDASTQLRRHFRYPEDMFRVQSELFRTYHIPEADEFYTKEDAWNLPVDAALAANDANDGSSVERSLRPYYQLMRLPGEDREEFALIQPYTPVERNNLTAWLAGSSDPGNYGELKAYLMPPNKTVFGPQQVQARIDQDARVSEQITLWNQSGSRVIYGNLLVIPVGGSLLYAQPLFLRAEQSDIPELKKVVLVLGDQVVMENNLAEALVALFGRAPDVELPGVDEVPGPGVPEAPTGPAGSQVESLVGQALQRFAAADEALREGDLGTYQEETTRARRLLQRAERLLEATAPSGPSSPSAG